jgi:hypothetical protein
VNGPHGEGPWRLPIDVASFVPMKDAKTTWDDVRQMTDELKVKMHLAGMDLRERWKALQPRLEKLEQKVTAATDRAETAVAHEVGEVGALLRELRDDVKSKIK